MRKTTHAKENGRKELEKMFKKHGYDDFEWINPKNIVVAQWARMKCMFGCKNYGKCGTCPPNTPSVAESKEFVRGYKTCAVFHFTQKVKRPKDRFAWTRKVNLGLIKLEREVFLSGYEKAFLLFMDSCGICEKCSGDRATCKQPRLSRPTPEAMAVDVFSTVRKAGYPIEVLADTSLAMNRYAFLMIR